MDLTPFAEYRRAQHSLVGTGGCCDGVERWICTSDYTEYAVKKLSFDRLSQSPVASNNELTGLSCSSDVPRIVRLHEFRYDDTFNCYFILELLRGNTLADFLHKSRHCTEAFVLNLAAQLLDTVEYMHSQIGMVHGDISINNLMLHKAGANWELRMFDLGCCRVFPPGATKIRLAFDGHTLPYASPEVLACKLGHLTGQVMTETDLRLDLTTAEMYSVGVVMFQILTHHLPFDLTPCPGLSLPAQLDDAETALEWAQHHSIHQQQLPLADALDWAEQTEQPVQHPLAEEIRHLSRTPDQAVDFFMCILQPDPAKRLTASQAANHPYLQAAMSKIPRDWCAATPPSGASAIGSADSADGPSGTLHNSAAAHAGGTAPTSGASVAAARHHAGCAAATTSGSFCAERGDFGVSPEHAEASFDSGTFDSVSSAHSLDLGWSDDSAAVRCDAPAKKNRLGRPFRRAFGLACRVANSIATGPHQRSPGGQQQFVSGDIFRVAKPRPSLQQPPGSSSSPAAHNVNVSSQSDTAASGDTKHAALQHYSEATLPSFSHVQSTLQQDSLDISHGNAVQRPHSEFHCSAQPLPVLDNQPSHAAQPDSTMQQQSLSTLTAASHSTAQHQVQSSKAVVQIQADCTAQPAAASASAKPAALASSRMSPATAQTLLPHGGGTGPTAVVAMNGRIAVSDTDVRRLGGPDGKAVSEDGRVSSDPAASHGQGVRKSKGAWQRCKRSLLIGGAVGVTIGVGRLLCK